MGTRGAIGFIHNDELKASYNHFDSYPEGLGYRMIDAANAIHADLDGYRAKIDALTYVDERNDPSFDDFARFAAAGIRPQNVSTGSDWYALLRDLQGDLVRQLDVGYMVENSAFLEDSLFCEFAYIVDLDRDKLIVLRGFNQSHADQWDRVALPNDEWEPEYPGQRRYFAVSKVGELDLPATRDNLMALFPEEEDAA